MPLGVHICIYATFVTTSDLSAPMLCTVCTHKLVSLLLWFKNNTRETLEKQTVLMERPLVRCCHLLSAKRRCTTMHVSVLQPSHVDMHVFSEGDTCIITPAVKDHSHLRTLQTLIFTQLVTMCLQLISAMLSQNLTDSDVSKFSLIHQP